MDVDAAVLRTRLGLAEDADEAAITEALSAEPETQVEAAAEPERPQIPEGMALIDQETLDTLRTGAEAGVSVAARLATEDRNTVIAAAIQDGKFPPGRREHYEKAWERDPEGTRTLLTASVADGGLAPGLVPVGRRETGVSGDGEGSQSDDASHAQFMAAHYPTESRRLSNRDNGRSRVRQEA